MDGGADNGSSGKTSDRPSGKPPGNSEGKNPPTLFCFGTFDLFNSGHKGFLDRVSQLAKSLLVGIEKDPSDALQSFETRKASLEKYLETKEIQYEIITLESNLFEATKERPTLLMLAVGEGSSFAKEDFQSLNSERASSGLPPLIRIEIPAILGENGIPLTTENIRKGLIDSEGRVPKSFKKLAKTGHKIRDNIAEILLESGYPLYGYEISKKYNRRYGKLSLRLTYYHLGKGVSEGVFRIVEKKKIPGGFSWGGLSERIYYSLGDGKT